jgi:hypothetical protein
MTDMATSSKPASPARGKPSAGPSSVQGAASSKAFLRFFHSEVLRKKTLLVLNTIERAEDATAHRDAIADIVVELTNSGLDYYFMNPLKLAKAGFVVEQSANIGMAGAQQVMGSVIRNVIRRMESDQLLSVCGSIRQFML